MEMLSTSVVLMDPQWGIARSLVWNVSEVTSVWCTGIYLPSRGCIHSSIDCFWRGYSKTDSFEGRFCLSNQAKRLFARISSWLVCLTFFFWGGGPIS